MECLSTIRSLRQLSCWKKHREAPYYETAATLSLNYVVLAFRKNDGRAVLRDRYISEALMWKREAINLLAQATSSTL